MSLLSWRSYHFGQGFPKSCLSEVHSEFQLRQAPRNGRWQSSVQVSAFLLIGFWAWYWTQGQAEHGQESTQSIAHSPQIIFLVSPCTPPQRQWWGIRKKGPVMGDTMRYAHLSNCQTVKRWQMAITDDRRLINLSKSLKDPQRSFKDIFNFCICL